MPPSVYLAAAAVVIAAAVVAATQVVATAVAEQQDQDDDPADVTATETIVIAHNEYLQEFFERQLPLIPRYSPAPKRCNEAELRKVILATPNDIFPDGKVIYSLWECDILLTQCDICLRAYCGVTL